MAILAPTGSTGEAGAQTLWDWGRPAEAPARAARPATRQQRQQTDHLPHLSEPGSRTGAGQGGAAQRTAAPATSASNRAPPPRRGERKTGRNVVVLGDSLADWLGHGLEVSFEELEAAANDLGVLRRGRHGSSLILNTPRGFDWVQVARDTLAKDQPHFVVVMLGLGDRASLRELPPPVPLPRPAGEGGDFEEPTTRAQPVGRRGPYRPETHEFRSERWSELYTHRVDQLMAVLKARGSPVLWVGLPPMQNTRLRNDVVFLNGLYRQRAEKAGIQFVDIWDLFLGEDGNYTQTGPDVLGQRRQLRSPDGIHFTVAGARKLAHFIDREIKRLMLRQPAIALPMPDGTTGTPREAAERFRPAVGPVIPLTGGTPASETLLGANPWDDHIADPLALRVLVRGAPPPERPGRADHFVWPLPHAATENAIVTPGAPGGSPAPGAAVETPEDGAIRADGGSGAEPAVATGAAGRAAPAVTRAAVRPGRTVR